MNETVDADRLIVMNEGKIELDGAPAQVFSQVERLRGLGLEVPDTTGLLYALNQKGFDLPLGAFSVEACAEAIFKSIKE